MKEQQLSFFNEERILCPQFQEVIVDAKTKELAVEHAIKRTRDIVRQFVPQNAPLTALESNYIGSIGELAVRKYLEMEIKLDDNYDNHQVDNGDIEWNNMVYDVKTDAIPSDFYIKLREGSLKKYEKYGCRVFSAKHLHHLGKYTGGLIFCAFQIPNNARETKNEIKPHFDILNMRDFIALIENVLIIGLIEQGKVADFPPTWYTPKDPKTGNVSQYNSPNYIFHHSELISIKSIK